MAVHNELGGGFTEPVYQDAFEVELRLKNLPFTRETPVTVLYRGLPLKSTYRTDFICFDAIVTELKAVRSLLPEHEAQVINYLKATGLHRGLLFNFFGQKLEFKRIVLDYRS